GDRPRTGRRGHDRAADHPISGGSRPTGRLHRRHRLRPRHRVRAAERAQADAGRPGAAPAPRAGGGTAAAGRDGGLGRGSRGQARGGRGGRPGRPPGTGHGGDDASDTGRDRPGLVRSRRAHARRGVPEPDRPPGRVDEHGNGGLGMTTTWDTRRGVIAQSASMAARSLASIRNNPATLIEFFMIPLMILLSVTFFMGGQMMGSWQDFLQDAGPTISAMGLYFAAPATGVALFAALKSGVFDRLTAMPVSRFALLGGRVAADMVKHTWALLVVGGVAV